MKNGYLLINKEEGPTSFDVVRKIKKGFKTKKVGHAGTLDPLACGLLIVGINNGTKTIRFLENLPKEYVFEIKLGKKSATFDREGPFVEEKKVTPFDKKDILNVIEKVKKTKEQTPPIYSAIKVDGKKLYEYARENKQVEIKPKKIKIYDLDLISYTKDSLILKCFVSKGTYVRSLAMSIAYLLNNLGYVSYLKRSKIGPFSLNDAKTLEKISEDDILSNYDIFDEIYPKVIVNEKVEKKIKNGQKVSLPKRGLFFVCNKNKEVIAFFEESKCLRVLN